MQPTPSVQSRETSFTVAEDVATPQSLKTFGGAYVFLWLGMLGLIYFARRKQLILKTKLSELEAVLQRRG